MKNGLTIYDISKLSGVSIATVSRVLNGKRLYLGADRLGRLISKKQV